MQTLINGLLELTSRESSISSTSALSLPPPYVTEFTTTSLTTKYDSLHSLCDLAVFLIRSCFHPHTPLPFHLRSFFPPNFDLEAFSLSPHTLPLVIDLIIELSSHFPSSLVPVLSLLSSFLPLICSSLNCLSSNCTKTLYFRLLIHFCKSVLNNNFDINFIGFLINNLLLFNTFSIGKIILNSLESLILYYTSESNFFKSSNRIVISQSLLSILIDHVITSRDHLGQICRKFLTCKGLIVFDCPMECILDTFSFQFSNYSTQLSSNFNFEHYSSLLTFVEEFALIYSVVFEPLNFSTQNFRLWEKTTFSIFIVLQLLLFFEKNNANTSLEGLGFSFDDVIHHLTEAQKGLGQSFCLDLFVLIGSCFVVLILLKFDVNILAPLIANHLKLILFCSSVSSSNFELIGKLFVTIFFLFDPLPDFSKFLTEFLASTTLNFQLLSYLISVEDSSQTLPIIGLKLFEKKPTINFCFVSLLTLEFCEIFMQKIEPNISTCQYSAEAFLIILSKFPQFLIFHPLINLFEIIKHRQAPVNVLESLSIKVPKLISKFLINASVTELNMFKAQIEGTLLSIIDLFSSKKAVEPQVKFLCELFNIFLGHNHPAFFPLISPIVFHLVKQICTPDCDTKTRNFLYPLFLDLVNSSKSTIISEPCFRFCIQSLLVSDDTIVSLIVNDLVISAENSTFKIPDFELFVKTLFGVPLETSKFSVKYLLLAHLARKIINIK
ncbi:hypothetical protein RCL1_008353 [Eukaryota sp. TZLM3-RCL]